MTHRLALCIAMAFTLTACSAPSEPPGQPASPAAAPAVQKAAFGTTKEGAAVEVYTLTNRNGMTAKVMTYGATLTELLVPDRTGTPGNIVLGFDTIEPYLAGVPFLGVDGRPRRQSDRQGCVHVERPDLQAGSQ